VRHDVGDWLGQKDNCHIVILIVSLVIIWMVHNIAITLAPILDVQALDASVIIPAPVVDVDPFWWMPEKSNVWNVRYVNDVRWNVI
jgi:hypothetical protein